MKSYNNTKTRHIYDYREAAVLVFEFHAHTNHSNQSTSGATRSYAFWASIIGGIVAIIFLIVHILVPQPLRSIVGAFVSILN